MPSTGIERFIAMTGGEANLPPEEILGAENILPRPAVHEEAQDDKDPYDGLPTVEEVIRQNQAEEQASKLRRLPQQQERDSNVTTSPLPHSQANTGAEPSLQSNELPPRGIHFSPFVAVTKFCYNPSFVNQKWLQPFATAFFDANKIFQRPWDIYYIWSTHYHTGKPIALVPELQLQALINEINEAFPEAKISITEESREDGLVLDFDNLPDALRPRWLGLSSSRNQYDSMMESLPQPTAGKVPDDRSLEAYKAMIDAANELNKNKSKKKREANQQTAVLRRQDMSKQVLRAQRFLGLAPSGSSEDLASQMSTLGVQPIDPESPPPHPFFEDAIFIAFDCEAYERAPKLITEVGFATLDTRDLQDAPGPDGKNWHKHVRGRHFRVVEYKHLRNHDFVEGCPDFFEFGESEFVSKDNLPSALASCFHEPYSKKSLKPSEASWPALGEARKPDAEEKRNIILLGHDVNQDIVYLQSIGFDVTNGNNRREVMDTVAMMRAYTRDPNPTALGKILYYFNQTGWHLHNAGNDAVYTMHAMLAIAVRSATERGSEEVENKHAETFGARTAEAVQRAREKVSDESEGWVTNAHLMMGGGAAESERPVFGPEEPPKSTLMTSGGAVLDV